MTRKRTLDLLDRIGGPAHTHFGGYAHQGATRDPRRAMTLLLVAALHAAALYGLLISVSTYMKTTPTSLVTTIIDSNRREERPLPPGPRLTGTIIQVPTPPAGLRFESDASDVTAGPLEATGAGSAPTVPHVVSRVQGGPGIGFPSTADFYPSVAIYRREKGIATVQACVDAQGRLTAEPTIVQSTGVSRLDEGAISLAKAGSGHYRATIEDGQPVSSCYSFRIRFDLKD